ncbi:MAG: coiled-coil domain-containing protein [Candidatus Hodarchaeota archaeon]
MNKSLKLLQFFREYRKIANLNSELIVQYIDIVQSLIYILNYNLLVKRKNQLLKELELSKIKTKSRDIAAKTDFLNKLSEAIKENKKKLKYREEDFLFLKNQRDQIEDTIKNFNLKIQELNKKKKECFNQINRITRELSENTQKNNLDLTLNDKNNLSQSEKIKALQKQAKDLQYQINHTKSKLNKSQLKFNEINPKYEILEKDYNMLLKVIKNDNERLKNVRKELEEEVSYNREEFMEKIDFNELEFLKLPQEIESEIQKIDYDLNMISKANSLLDNNNPKKLIKIKNKLIEIDKILKNNQKNVSISFNNDEIKDSIENFRRIEIISNNLENLLNKFLIEINLNTNLQIKIIKNYKNFSINLEFIRSNKENLRFNKLTTPEKIFFVITFYISIQIHLGSKNIIFSNLFIPKIYNKRGSVYRTIRRILPVLEKENNLKKFNLIFIISNLEMKKPIENVKVIKIESS